MCVAVGCGFCVLLDLHLCFETNINFSVKMAFIFYMDSFAFEVWFLQHPGSHFDTHGLVHCNSFYAIIFEALINRGQRV